MPRFIGIEAGGTKFVCALSQADGEIEDRVRIPTTTSAETLQQVIAYIHKHHTEKTIDAIGIASFGPLELDKNAANYGHITSSPKPGWQNIDFVGRIKREFNLPIGFDTDVNGAALGEQRWGAAQDLDHFLYMTVGTGIGVGAMIEGKLLHGALHPEMGHMLILQNHELDDFEGVCPYHRNCLEGLASGPSMQKRWNVNSALDLPPEHKAWDIEAYYLAVACTNFIYALAPKRIIIGGGVMQQQQLFKTIPKLAVTLNNEYVKSPTTTQILNNFIYPTGLGINSGILGAIALAEQAHDDTIEHEALDVA